MSYFSAPVDVYGNPLPFAVSGGTMIPVARRSMPIAQIHVPVSAIRMTVQNTPRSNTYNGGYSERVILPKPQIRGRLATLHNKPMPEITPYVKMTCALKTLKTNVLYIMERTSNSSSRDAWYVDALQLIDNVEAYENMPFCHDDGTSMTHFRLLSALVAEGNEVLLRR